MGRINDSPGLDESRPAPDYGDPTGEEVVRSVLRGERFADWRIVGPKLVIQYTEKRGLGDGEPTARAMFMPTTSGQSVQIVLMPEVAAAVFRMLLAIAEPAPSRSRKSLTYRLKKKEPASVATKTGSNQFPPGRERPDQNG